MRPLSLFLCLLIVGCQKPPAIKGYQWGTSAYGVELYSADGENAASVIYTLFGSWAQACVYNTIPATCRYFKTDAQAFAYVAEKEKP